MAKGKRIGVTSGLEWKDCGDDGRPEQVYVWMDVENEHRPIRVEGWVGYRVPMRMRLTKRQAKDLSKLLVDALVEDE